MKMEVMLRETTQRSVIMEEGVKTWFGHWRTMMNTLKDGWFKKIDR